MDNWSNDLAGKHNIKKISAREDLSLPTLERLLNDGYTIVVWQTASTQSCFRCQDLNGQQWPLIDFLSNLNHVAPIAEHGHPNDNCTLSVSGDGVNPVIVDYNGNIG